MTLRFFRRKPGAAQNSDNEPAPNQDPPSNPSTSQRPARRRRGGTSSTSASKGRTKPDAGKEQEAAKPPASAKPPSRRTRRGRRGGAGRKASAKPAEGTTVAEPAPAAPSRAAPATPDEASEELTDRQLTVLKGLQGSLSAIENRLAGIGQVAPAGERQRIGIFVDVPNVMYAAERLKLSIDFGKLLTFLSREREMVRASAYAPITDDPQTKLEDQKFVQPFVGLGYRIVIKAWKRLADGSMKANFDVELAIDVLTMSDRLDSVYLVSGDGDFRRLVEIVASKGVRVVVVAFGQSTAAELRAVADEYIDINDHLAELRVK